MKLYYMHPGRKQDGVFKYCGCYFGAAPWKESKTPSDKTRWKCACDYDRVQLAFPDEYAAALTKHPDLRSKNMGTCGLQYRPFKDGPAMLMELLVDDEWIPIVSEFLPEHIMDRFKQAQAEWYEVLRSDSTQSVKLKILQNATKPSIQRLVQDYDLKVVGKFPLKEFYEDNQKAVSAVDWVRYFIEVAEQADKPGLNMLKKVCRKYLEKHELQHPKLTPELLPGSLSRGSRE